MSADEKAPPRLNLRFLHVPCADVQAMRRFYEEGLGMQLASFTDEERWGWAVFQSEGLQLMFHRWDEGGEVPVPEGFAWQPGDGEGTRPAMSYGIELPEADYAETVARLAAQGAPALTPTPTWRQDSYWGWTVRDPGGNTVEVYCAVAERPASTDWA